ncbi:MAG: hypothetical protein LBP22_12215 [Deltaproteobacteria bacterium]|nr:hypothetical protein [Deltaproteobacteria bacterium]
MRIKVLSGMENRALFNTYAAARVIRSGTTGQQNQLQRISRILRTKSLACSPKVSDFRSRPPSSADTGPWSRIWAESARAAQKHKPPADYFDSDNYITF